MSVNISNCILHLQCDIKRRTYKKFGSHTVVIKSNLHFEQKDAITWLSEGRELEQEVSKTFPYKGQHEISEKCRLALVSFNSVTPGKS